MLRSRELGGVRPPPNPERRPSLSIGPADWMTIAHGLCGYLAIALLVGRWLAHGHPPGVTIGDLRVAGVLVVIGAVLDLFDGPVARRFGASGLGELLDGMCDTVTFGMVPAVLTAAAGTALSPPVGWALIAAGGVYLAAMILRLARSELTPADSLAHGFQGLPSAPAGAAAMCVIALRATPVVTCLLVLSVAVLVVGRYHFPRQRPGLMPIMAGGPAIGFLGIWGVLPLRPALIVTMISTVLLPAAAAFVTWRERDSGTDTIEPLTGAIVPIDD